MAYIRWQKDMETGIAAIDADHRRLVHLINQVHDSIDSNEEYATLGSILAALADYADDHFRREEVLMEQAGYPGLIGHRALHGKFSAQLHAIDRRYRASQGAVRSIDILKFLERWLVDHILHQDMAYCPCLLEHVGAPLPAIPPLTTLDPHDATRMISPEWRRLSVLIVDDNSHFLTLMQTILTSVGVGHVYQARNAFQGLEQLSRRAFDVVISDWYMDGMNGLEFVRTIRTAEDPILARVGVIMVSGRSTADVRELLTAQDISAFMEKPISAKDLLNTLARVAGIKITDAPVA